MTPTAMTDPLNPDLTPIQQFYTKTNIFITGGTGFLGKGKFNYSLNWSYTSHTKNDKNIVSSYFVRVCSVSHVTPMLLNNCKNNTFFLY